jgi:transposase
MTRPRLKLVNHASLEDLEKGYRQARDPIERSHWQIIWLFHQHHDAYIVASMTAYCADWVRKLVARYNQQGLKALQDLRHQNPGNPRVLTLEQEQALEQALLVKAKGKSLWTGQEVARWIESTTGRKTSLVTGWRYLKRLDYSLQTPRPKHLKSASEIEREAFKKNLRLESVSSSSNTQPKPLKFGRKTKDELV